jgi:outer membrane protein, heavy metal efflux system
MYSTSATFFAEPMRKWILFGSCVYALACFSISNCLIAAEPVKGQIANNAPSVAPAELVVRTQALQIQHLPPVDPPQSETVIPQVIPPTQLPQKRFEAQAQQPSMPLPTVLTLKDLENIALQNNPSLTEAAARTNALRGKWEQVGLPPNPYVGYSDQQLGSPSVEQRGAVFGQEFVRGGKLTLNRAVVSQEVQKAEQQFSIQNLRVLTDVRIAYYEVLSAQQRSVLAQQLTQNTSQTVNTLEKLLGGGQVSKVDVIQVKIENQSSLMLKQRSDNQYIEAWRKLAAILGTPSMQPLPLNGNLEGDLPLYDWNSSLNRLICSSPEVAAAQAEIQRTRWGYQRAMAEKSSNLSFQGIIQHDKSVDDVNGALQVTFPVPLWNKNQGGIAQAGHESIAAERALEKLQLDLQHRLATVFQRYESNRQQVERYSKEILPLARENLELIRKAQQAGEFDNLKYLLAQRTFSQTNLEYINSLQELRTVALEIDGMLLSNSLQSGVEN